jgi:dTDP-glucose 4,6-dehydratase
MSKILITGVLGTIGIPLREKLIRNGHDVYGLDIKHSDMQQSLDDNYYRRIDIRNFRKLEEYIAEIQPDYVYHLAAEFGRINGNEWYEDCISTNLIGTQHILELQRTFGFKLIFASSSEVYGETDLNLNEELTNQVPIVHHNTYAASKMFNEHEIKRYQDRYGSEIMTLRFFNSYGPGEYYHPYRSVVCLFCYRLMYYLPITVYKNYHRVFMYMDDFINTLSKFCDDFRAGETYNIGGSEYRSVEEMTYMIINDLAERGYDKNKLEDCISLLSEDQHNVVNKKPNIIKVCKNYNHTNATSLRTGIHKTLDWMFSVYGGK